MENKKQKLAELSDRELLQLMVVSLVQLEKRISRLEKFVTDKFGDQFSSIITSEGDDLKKTILDYHDDALSEMESN